MSRLRHKRSEHTSSRSRASGGGASRADHSKPKHIAGEGEAPKPHAGKRARGGWIAGAIKHKGALRKSLGVKQGEPIPAAKLEKAAHSDNPTLRRRAALAKTLRSFHH